MSLWEKQSRGGSFLIAPCNEGGQHYNQVDLQAVCASLQMQPGLWWVGDMCLAGQAGRIRSLMNTSGNHSSEEVVQAHACVQGRHSRGRHLEQVVAGSGAGVHSRTERTQGGPICLEAGTRGDRGSAAGQACRTSAQDMLSCRAD